MTICRRATEHSTLIMRNAFLAMSNSPKRLSQSQNRAQPKGKTPRSAESVHGLCQGMHSWPKFDELLISPTAFTATKFDL